MDVDRVSLSYEERSESMVDGPLLKHESANTDALDRTNLCPCQFEFIKSCQQRH